MTAPRPCECGEDLLSFVHATHDNPSAHRYRPVSPDAAPPRCPPHDFMPDDYDHPRCRHCGRTEAEAAPPRATTESHCEHEWVRFGDWSFICSRCNTPKSRVSLASAPTKSGALLNALERYSQAFGRAEAAGVHPDALANNIKREALARAAVDRHIATLERDAARMRGIERAAIAYIAAVDAPVGSADRIWDTRADLRRALSPSGEPPTKTSDHA